jgi:predicted DNA-binding protein
LSLEKKATSFRLSKTAKRLLAELARHLGVSQGAVLELLIREKAKEERVK